METREPFQSKGGLCVPWTMEEDLLLRSWIGSAAEFAIISNRSKCSIQARRSLLRKHDLLVSDRFLRGGERHRLYDWYAQHRGEDLARRATDKSAARDHRTKWEPFEMAEAVNSSLDDAALAVMLNRTLDSVEFVRMRVAKTKADADEMFAAIDGRSEDQAPTSSE